MAANGTERRLLARGPVFDAFTGTFLRASITPSGQAVLERLTSDGMQRNMVGIASELGSTYHTRIVDVLPTGDGHVVCLVVVTVRAEDESRTRIILIESVSLSRIGGEIDVGTFRSRQLLWLDAALLPSSATGSGGNPRALGLMSKNSGGAEECVYTLFIYRYDEGAQLEWTRALTLYPLPIAFSELAQLSYERSVVEIVRRGAGEREIIFSYNGILPLRKASPVPGTRIVIAMTLPLPGEVIPKEDGSEDCDILRRILEFPRGLYSRDVTSPLSFDQVLGARHMPHDYEGVEIVRATLDAEGASTTRLRDLADWRPAPLRSSPTPAPTSSSLTSFLPVWLSKPTEHRRLSPRRRERYAHEIVVGVAPWGAGLACVHWSTDPADATSDSADDVRGVEWVVIFRFPWHTRAHIFLPSDYRAGVQALLSLRVHGGARQGAAERGEESQINLWGELPYEVFELIIMICFDEYLRANGIPTREELLVSGHLNGSQPVKLWYDSDDSGGEEEGEEEDETEQIVDRTEHTVAPPACVVM